MTAVDIAKKSEWCVIKNKVDDFHSVNQTSSLLPLQLSFPGPQCLGPPVADLSTSPQAWLDRSDCGWLAECGQGPGDLQGGRPLLETRYSPVRHSRQSL